MSCLSCAEFYFECLKHKAPKPRQCPHCPHYLRNPDHIIKPAKTHDRESCLKCEEKTVSTCPTKWKSGHSTKCTSSYTQVKTSFVEKEYNDIKENLPDGEAEITQGQKMIDLIQNVSNLLINFTEIYSY